MEHILKIAINALSRDEAIDEVNDLMTIRNAIKSRADLKMLAKLLQENPGIIRTAKNFLGK